LEGKCQQKESVNRNWKKGYLKKVGEEFTGSVAEQEKGQILHYGRR
jgi:hypothetical protein